MPLPCVICAHRTQRLVTNYGLNCKCSSTSRSLKQSSGFTLPYLCGVSSLKCHSQPRQSAYHPHPPSPPPRAAQRPWRKSPWESAGKDGASAGLRPHCICYPNPQIGLQSGTGRLGSRINGTGLADHRFCLRAGGGMFTGRYSYVI